MTNSRSMEAILGSLNPAQRMAVETVEGPLMTLAGPGSGKTRVVTHRIAHMIDQGIPSRSILAMTFTNKAAQTIRERVYGLTGHQHPITMGTFHGFGARFLRWYGRCVGLDENFSILDSDDSKRLLNEAVDESQVKLTHTPIGDLVREISRLKTNLVTPDSINPTPVKLLDQLVLKVYPLYQRKLLSNRAVDFDDLLLYPAHILRSEPELRAELDARYRYILVDEYQDTNFAQYALVRALSVDYPNLNVTGDPDQSIYSWRGANIENIHSFDRDYPNANVVRLEVNYRSTPEILSLADALIQNNRRRKAKHLIPSRTSGRKVRLVNYVNDEAEAEDICDQIKSAILEQGAKPSDFAILYRTNALSRLFERGLLKRRLNYQLIGGFRFYQRQEIKDLLAYLRLVYNPRDDVAFDRVVNTPPRGLGTKTLEKVAEVARHQGFGRIEGLGRAIDDRILTKKAAASAEEFLKLYRELLELSEGPIVQLLQHVIKSVGYVDYLARRKSLDEDDGALDSNIRELLADARKVDEQFPDGEGLQNFLEQVSLLSETDTLGQQADRVTLMTLHAAKGLEFPHVYLAAIEQDVLPHARCRHQPEQIEEERRLFFVGITRAEDTLQLSSASRRGFNQRTSVPSHFLMEIPRLELEIIDAQHSDYDEDPFDDLDDFAGDSHAESPDEIDVSEKHCSWRTSLQDDVGQESAHETVVDLNSDESHDATSPVVRKRHAEPWAKKTRSATTSQKAPKPTVSATGLTDLKSLLKTGASIEAVRTKAGVDVSDFQVGSEVLHPQLGNGRVLSIEGHGSKRRATVEYESDTNTVILAFSPLRLVAGHADET
jgi:DNA helicase II / ATP-dependent DNA helicase PcrA